MKSITCQLEQNVSLSIWQLHVASHVKTGFVAEYVAKL